METIPLGCFFAAVSKLILIKIVLQRNCFFVLLYRYSIIFKTKSVNSQKARGNIGTMQHMLIGKIKEYEMDL